MDGNREATARQQARFSVTTRRPVAILMIVAAVCVFGWVSYQRLPLDLMPEISYPTLTVRTEYPGTAPEEVESLVSRPLEQELGITPHLVGISSISRAGLSDVVLEFEWDADMNAASQEIREKVDRVFLPQDAGRPLLLRYDPALDPIVRLGLYGPQSLYELRYLAEHEIKRELEAIAGVAAVKVKGGLEEEIHVALNEHQMAIMGLDIGQINKRLAQNNVNLPGGNLREGQTEYLVRTLNEFRSLDEIARLVVARRQGAEVRLRDIAQIHTSHKDRTILTRVDGRESIEIEIFKEADANIASVARAVRARLYGLPEQRAYVEKLAKKAAPGGGKAEKPGGDKGDIKEKRRREARRAMEHLRLTDFIAYRLPPGAKLEVLSDQSIFIVNSIEEVQKSALLGGAMAILVLFVFLRHLVHTLIVGLTIPVSIVATFAPMHLFGVSLNIMSLGGLALGVGMLVDNSIVVLESIFRCREEGDDLVRATVRGTGEVGSAVLASTLTTIAVFFPIVFVEGVAGQIFGDMALTVVFSLLASLGVALFFVPMLASRRVERSRLGEGVRESDFFRLRAPQRARRALESGQPLRRRAAQGALALPYLLGEVLWRLLLLAATLAAAAAKTLAVVLFELSWWLAKPMERLWIRPQRSFQATVGAWAAADGLGPRTFSAQVWPGLLRLGAAQKLAADMERFWNWLGGSNPLWSGGKALFFAPAAAYLLFRFLLHSLLHLAGIAVQAALMLVGLVGIAAVFLLGMLLRPLLAPLLFLFESGFGLVQRAYPLLLGLALRRRLPVVVVALGSFWFCWTQLVPRLGRELIPLVHQGEFTLELALPAGAPLEKTAAVARLVEEQAMRQPEVERVATTVGTDKTASTSSEEGENTARIAVRLKEGSDAGEEERLIERLRSGFGGIPEVQIEVSHPALFSFKTPVEVEIHGYDLSVLRRLSRQAEAALAALPGLVDVKSSLQAGNPELQIAYRRERLAEYGLDLRSVAELVRNKVQGWVPTELRRQERQIDIRVRLRREDRLGLEELRRLVINPGAEIPIPLAAVAAIRVNEGPSEIRRIDQQRAALITANIHNIDLGTASRRIEGALRHLDYPSGFGFLISGQNREMETSMRSLLFALALAVFLVYIVMASQFESLLHPLVIMCTVPLALVGSVAALYLSGTPLSIVVFIGLIMLAGIVVNNAIVLVDYINTLRRGGMEKYRAIIQAASVRLRPILMTTLTTVLGLLPMALGLGEGAEIRTPMALTVIAGLSSSTFLTLIAIPVVYSLVDRRP